MESGKEVKTKESNQGLEDDDIVLCTVKDVDKTAVFVSIDSHPEIEGSIVMSEIAAGRIRNIRDYVSPNKKIVCKILKIQNNHAQLSFRRVTSKERDQVLEGYKHERTLLSMLKSITDEAESVLDKIKAEEGVIEFIERVKEDKRIIERFLKKDLAEKLGKILSEKKVTEKSIKKEFTLKSNLPTGLEDIKYILDIADKSTENTKLSYLGSGKFSITAKAKDFKIANQICQKVLEEIEKKAKERKAVFEHKEK